MSTKFDNFELVNYSLSIAHHVFRVDRYAIQVGWAREENLTTGSVFNFGPLNGTPLCHV